MPFWKPFKFWLTNFDRVPFIKVYTHGACDMNGQSGALASSTVYFGYNDRHNWYGIDVPGGQTSQRAALYAVIKALEIIVANRDRNYYCHKRVAVFTNSDYPEQVWNRGWKRSLDTGANYDLVRRLLEFKKYFMEVCGIQFVVDLMTRIPLSPF
jgi:ribonuclease HI